VNDTPPIATYRERRFDGKRAFELFAGRVVIRGHAGLTSRFETTILLNTLDPTFSRIWLRSSGFRASLWLLLGSIVFISVLLTLRVPPESPPIILLGCIGASGVLLLLTTFRAVEFAVYRSPAGVVTLDVARSGPDAKKFDAFVDVLTRNVGMAREQIVSTPTENSR
jgi:hypothetical protein